MQRRVFTSVAAVSLLAAACSDTPQQPETAAQFQFQDGSVVCDYNQGAQRASRDFFNQPAQNEVRAIIQDMSNATDPAVLNDLGFQVLVRVRDAIGTSLQQGSLLQGSNLINEILACMSFDPAEAPATAIDFTAALGPAGAFDFRGGAGDPLTAPVVSADGNWGVEPVLGADWPTVTGGERILIHGAPTANGLGGENEVTFAFDFKDLPNIDFFEDVVVSTCLVQNDRYRVQRETQILPVADPSFCPQPSLTRSIGGSGPLALARRLVRLVTPAPLYADAAVVGKGGTGGTAGGFTRFVAVDAGAINLEFLDSPVDVTIDPLTGEALLSSCPATDPGYPCAIRVYAYGNNGTPLPEVDITVDWNVNNGTNVTLGGTTTLRTDPQCSSVDSCLPTGTVSYDDLTLNKPGGYVLVATASLFGFSAPGTATSTAFHVGQ
jgi:hypothetical protein